MPKYLCRQTYAQIVYLTINTTNTILVNHTSALKHNFDLFMHDYQNIMSEISVQKSNEIKEYIKSAFQDALQEGEDL